MKQQTWIKTARDHEAVRRYGGNYAKFVEMATEQQWHGAKVNWSFRGNCKAQISNSSWIVKCPYCANAIIHEPGAPFYCSNCLMEANDGFALTVEYPENRAEIEAVLLKRPVPANRNWVPKETLADLEKENADHGIGKEDEKPKAVKPKGTKNMTGLEFVPPELVPVKLDKDEKPEKPEKDADK